MTNSTILVISIPLMSTHDGLLLVAIGVVLYARLAGAALWISHAGSDLAAGL